MDVGEWINATYTVLAIFGFIVVFIAAVFAIYYRFKKNTDRLNIVEEDQKSMRITVNNLRDGVNKNSSKIERVAQDSSYLKENIGDIKTTVKELKSILDNFILNFKIERK